MKTTPLLLALAACEPAEKSAYDPCNVEGATPVDFADYEEHQTVDHHYGDCGSMELLGELKVVWKSTNANLDAIFAVAPDCTGVTQSLVLKNADEGIYEMDSGAELNTSRSEELGLNAAGVNEMNFYTELEGDCREESTGSYLLSGYYYVSIEQLALGDPKALENVWPVESGVYGFKADLDVALNCTNIEFILEGSFVRWAESCENPVVTWTPLDG